MKGELETSESPDARRGRIRRLGWGLLVGAMIAVLPSLATKLDNVALLLVGEILGWPGAILALGLGGWNAHLITVIVYYSTNLILYIGLTYFLLGLRKKRKRNQQSSGPSAGTHIKL
jgi:hypothetical protein